MKRLVEEILDLRRIEAGTLVIEPQVQSASHLVSEAVETFRPLAEEKALVLTTPSQTDSYNIYCDQERIAQVLSNLIGNSIKFTSSGGAIQVLVKEEREVVHFRVEDTGTGISSEQFPHLFDRFWQGKRANRQGVGLGLSIAKGIIDTHGGKIWAESQVGKGTTFHFTLPRAKAITEPRNKAESLTP